MLAARHHPAEAYRRVALDARIEGSDSARLTEICLETVGQSLDLACLADRRGDLQSRSKALTKAVSVITGLKRAIDPDNPLSAALHEFYAVALDSTRSAMTRFSEPSIRALRRDFEEILSAISQAGREHG